MEFPLHRFTAIAHLSTEEERYLRSVADAPACWQRNQIIAREGDQVGGVHLLINGWVAASMVLRSGRRQIHKLHLPGDILDSPSMALSERSDSLHAITETTTAFVSDEALRDMFSTKPRLTGLFLMAVQVERIALMDVLAAVGQASALERLAYLLMDLHRRLTPIGLVSDDAFDLVITQEIVGDLLGITAVHANRTFREIDERGLITREGGRIRLNDLNELRRLSPVSLRTPRHDPAWLPGVNVGTMSDFTQEVATSKVVRV